MHFLSHTENAIQKDKLFPKKKIEYPFSPISFENIMINHALDAKTYYNDSK